MLEGRERVLQDVEPLLRQVGLVAVLLQPFDEFLLRGNVILGLGDVPIHLEEVYQFAIAVGGGVAACLTRSAAVCQAGAWNPHLARWRPASPELTGVIPSERSRRNARLNSRAAGLNRKGRAAREPSSNRAPPPLRIAECPSAI